MVTQLHDPFIVEREEKKIKSYQQSFLKFSKDAI